MAPINQKKIDEIRAAMERRQKIDQMEETQKPRVVTTTWRPPKYTISDAFRIFLKRTNGHGWYRIHRARTMKGLCFWFALTFLCFSVGVIYTLTLWSRFQKYQTETEINTILGRLPFPAVTVCSSNPVKSSLIADMNLTIHEPYRQALLKGKENILKLLGEKIYKDSKLQGKELDIHYEAYKNLIYARNGTTKLDRQKVGFTFNELVPYCRFLGKPCTEKDFTLYQDDAYGNCYTFNQDNERLMVDAGSTNGLQLVFKLQPEENLEWYTETTSLRVAIHEPKSMPLPMLEGFAAPPGIALELGMKLEHFSRLQEPYNDPGCVNDINYFKQFFGYQYSNKGCRKTCEQTNIIDHCQCADWRHPQASIKQCDDSDKETIACLIHANDEFLKDPEYNCFCPPACEEKVYRVLTSAAKWNVNGFDPTLFNDTYGFDSHMTGQVNIFYRSGATTHFKDIPSETGAQFLGWVGGQLYAWTGASLITMIEFVMFIMTALLVLCTENVDWLMAE